MTSMKVSMLQLSACFAVCLVLSPRLYVETYIIIALGSGSDSNFISKIRWLNHTFKTVSGDLSGSRITRVLSEHSTGGRRVVCSVLSLLSDCKAPDGISEKGVTFILAAASPFASACRCIRLWF